LSLDQKDTTTVVIQYPQKDQAYIISHKVSHSYHQLFAYFPVSKLTITQKLYLELNGV